MSRPRHRRGGAGTGPRVFRVAITSLGLVVLLGGFGLPLLGLVFAEESAPFCCARGRCCCAGDTSRDDGRACLRRGCGCEQPSATLAGAPLSLEAVLPAPSCLPRLASRPLAGLPVLGLLTRPHSPLLPPPRLRLSA